MFGRLAMSRILNKGPMNAFATKANKSTVFHCPKPFRITVGGDMHAAVYNAKSKSGMVTEKSVPVKLNTDELHTDAERKSATKDLFSSSYRPDVKFSDQTATHCTRPLTNIQPTKSKPLIPIPPATSNDSAICTNPSDPHFHWLP